MLALFGLDPSRKVPGSTGHRRVCSNPECRVPFVSAASRAIYCSGRCRYAMRAARVRARNPKPLYTFKCRGPCGRRLTRVKATKYCSDKCRWAARRQANPTRKHPPCIGEKRTCDACYQDFVCTDPRHAIRRYCSRKCGNRLAMQEHRARKARKEHQP